MQGRAGRDREILAEPDTSKNDGNITLFLGKTKTSFDNVDYHDLFARFGIVGTCSHHIVGFNSEPLVCSQFIEL